MTLLTPGEYDDLPQALKDELAGVRLHPTHDYHDKRLRRWKGKVLNGDAEADPKSYVTVGYGTGDPKAPHPQ